jgi:hypothetical protein
MTSAIVDATATESLQPIDQGPFPDGPLSYPGNRWMASTRSKPVGTYRIAIVGDSMAYAAGIPYQHGFGARLAAHINGAAPGSWVECVTFGQPGACLYHAVGRVVTTALPTDPDLVVLCLCSNDAFPIGSAPAHIEGLAELWITFRPMIRRSLTTFREALTAAKRPGLVVYLDHRRLAANTCIPEQLHNACSEIGLPFVDGSEALETYQTARVVVSPVDGHLNGFASDVIARRVAQTLVDHRLIPASGFDDHAWLASIEAGTDARIAAGLDPLLACTEALAVLDAKWMHRRNVQRSRRHGEHDAVRARIVARQRAALREAALDILADRLKATCPVLDMDFVETQTMEAIAASAALEHYIATRDEQLLDTLTYLPPPADSAKDLTAAQSRWARIRAAARSVQQHAHSLATSGTPGDARHEAAYLRLWTGRMSAWCRALDYCCARYLALLPETPPPSSGAARLLTYVGERVATFEQRLEVVGTAIAEGVARLAGAARVAGCGRPTLEFTLSAPPGAEPWGFSVGIDSRRPAYSERQLGCSAIVRDGQPHRYEFDLPLTPSTDILVHVWGDGLQEQGRGLQVHRAAILWPGNAAAVTLPPFTIQSFSGRTARLVCPTVWTTPFAEPGVLAS